MSERIMPPDERVERFVKNVPLEAGLLVGLGIFLAGLTLLVTALLQWRQHHFGALSPSESLRLTIPSATLILLGVQTVFSSFLLSILGLKKR